MDGNVKREKPKPIEVYVNAKGFGCSHLPEPIQDLIYRIAEMYGADSCLVDFDGAKYCFTLALHRSHIKVKLVIDDRVADTSGIANVINSKLDGLRPWHRDFGADYKFYGFNTKNNDNIVIVAAKSFNAAKEEAVKTFGRFCNIKWVPIARNRISLDAFVIPHQAWNPK